MNDIHIYALLQAAFCGAICFMIAFKYRRGESSYHFFPSLLAFGLASLFGQQWLSIIGRVLFYGEWPIVSPFNTGIFAIIFLLILRARGNVARAFNFQT